MGSDEVVDVRGVGSPPPSSSTDAKSSTGDQYFSDDGGRDSSVYGAATFTPDQYYSDGGESFQSFYSGRDSGEWDDARLPSATTSQPEEGREQAGSAAVIEEDEDPSAPPPEEVSGGFRAVAATHAFRAEELPASNTHAAINIESAHDQTRSAGSKETTRILSEETKIITPVQAVGEVEETAPASAVPDSNVGAERAEPDRNTHPAAEAREEPQGNKRKKKNKNKKSKESPQVEPKKGADPPVEPPILAADLDTTPAQNVPETREPALANGNAHAPENARVDESQDLNQTQPPPVQTSQLPEEPSVPPVTTSKTNKSKESTAASRSKMVVGEVKNNSPGASPSSSVDPERRPETSATASAKSSKERVVKPAFAVIRDHDEHDEHDGPESELDGSVRTPVWAAGSAEEPMQAPEQLPTARDSNYNPVAYNSDSDDDVVVAQPAGQNPNYRRAASDEEDEQEVVNNNFGQQREPRNIKVPASVPLADPQDSSYVKLEISNAEASKSSSSVEDPDLVKVEHIAPGPAISTSQFADSSTSQPQATSPDDESRGRTPLEPTSSGSASSSSSSSWRGKKIWRHSEKARHLGETDEMARWWKHRNHVFVFTFSGKPVYTRYGNDEEITQFGVLQVIAAKMAAFFHQSNGKDVLRSITTTQRRFVFLEKGPLIMVCITGHLTLAHQALEHLLSRVYLQFVTIVTSTVERQLMQRPNLDIRNLLSGTQHVIGNLVRWGFNDMLLQVEGIEPLPLDPANRNVVTEALRGVRKIPNLLLACVIAGHRVVSLVTNRQTKQSASGSSSIKRDLVCVINYILSSNSLKGSESWTPICLPSVSDRAFTYAYIGYVPKTEVCQIFFSYDNAGPQFMAISSAARKITQQLRDTKVLEAIEEAMAGCPILISSSFRHMHLAPSYLSHSFQGQLAWLLDNVIHGCYFLEASQQYFTSAVREPYDPKYIFRNYSKCSELMLHCARPSQICVATDSECFYVWLQQDFRMFLTVPRGISTSVIGQFYQWVQTQELFIFLGNTPTW
ncbi:unnamed protein product [Amoebophrya sp. A120]|nr:unnamed protein product [Amoebophrya sp. A120]|eukprot:GSA120T00024000001.1